MPKENTFSREKFESVPSEFESDFKKLREDKRKCGEIMEKFVKDDRDPNFIEGFRMLYYGLKLRGRVSLINETLESRKLEFKDAAHAEAIRMEEKHRELQQHVINSVKELQRFEKEELGKNPGLEE